jgi:hypothetical protein
MTLPAPAHAAFNICDSALKEHQQSKFLVANAGAQVSFAKSANPAVPVGTTTADALGKWCVTLTDTDLYDITVDGMTVTSIPCGIGGAGTGGDQITVNGVAVTDAHFNDTTPAPLLFTAPNIQWRIDNSVSPAQIAAFYPYAGPTTPGILSASSQIIGGNKTMNTGAKWIASNAGVEFLASDDNPGCLPSNFTIFADASEAKLKACQAGQIVNLLGDGGGGGGGSITVEDDEFNQTVVTAPVFNRTSPAVPVGNTAVFWKTDGTGIIAYLGAAAQGSAGLVNTSSSQIFGGKKTFKDGIDIDNQKPLCLYETDAGGANKFCQQVPATFSADFPTLTWNIPDPAICTGDANGGTLTIIDNAGVKEIVCAADDGGGGSGSSAGSAGVIGGPPIYWNGSPTASFHFMSGVQSLREPEVAMALSDAGTLSKFTCWASVAPGAGKSYQYQVFKLLAGQTAGATQLGICIITGTGTPTCQTTNTSSAIRGDRLSFRMSPSGSPPPALMGCGVNYGTVSAGGDFLVTQLEFTAAALTTCATGQYWLRADSATSVLKKCENGVITDVGSGGGGGGAPTGAQYVVAAADATLTAERVLEAGIATSIDKAAAGQVRVDCNFATATSPGCVSILTQSFGGKKTFFDPVRVGDSGIPTSGYDLDVQGPLQIVASDFEDAAAGNVRVSLSATEVTDGEANKMESHVAGMTLGAASPYSGVALSDGGMMDFLATANFSPNTTVANSGDMAGMRVSLAATRTAQTTPQMAALLLNATLTNNSSPAASGDVLFGLDIAGGATAGTLTEFNSIRVRKATGTVTTQTGINVNPLSGGTAFKQGGTTDKNIFAGASHFGTLADPVAGYDVDVAGPMLVSNGLNFTAGSETCDPGEYAIYPLTSGGFKKCTNGIESDLGGGGGGAPTEAQYVVATADATLTAERVLTAGNSTTVDSATAGQIKVHCVPAGLGGTGCVSISTQVFGGKKSFFDGVRIGSTEAPATGRMLQVDGDVLLFEDGVEFLESDNFTATECTTGEYRLYADASEAKLKRCENGVLSDLGGGATGIPTVINVKDAPHNAICNGSTNDTAALRSAFAACPSTGCVIYVPHSTGLCMIAPSGSGPMLPLTTSNTTVRCAEGAGFKIMDNSLVAGIPGNMIANRNSAGSSVDLTTIVIDGCVWDGNDTTNGQPGVAEAMSFRRVSNLRIVNNALRDITYQGIATYLGTEVTIEGNTIFRQGQTVNSDAIQSNGTQHGIIANNVLVNIGEGIFVQHATGLSSSAINESQDVLVIGNTIINYVSNEVCQGAGVPYACCAGFHTGNSAGLCAAGVSGGSSIGILAQDVIVSGNQIRNANALSVQSGRTGDTTNVLITGNTIEGTPSNLGGIFLTVLRACTGGTGSQGAICTTNADCSGGTCTTYDLKDITISNNRIADTTPSGIHLRSDLGEGISNVTIRGNQILRPCLGGGTCAGIFLDGVDGDEPFTDILIEGNTIKDGSRYGVWMEPTETNVRLVDNLIDGNTSGMLNLAPPATPTEVHRLRGINNAIGNANGVQFSQLTSTSTGFGSVGNGSTLYCGDCLAGSHPCTSGGTGSTAQRINGAWDCGPSQIIQPTENGDVVSLETVSASSTDRVKEVVTQESGTTTSATLTTLQNVPLGLAAGQAALIEARIVARRTGGTEGATHDSAVYVLKGAYKALSGTSLSPIGGTFSPGVESGATDVNGQMQPAICAFASAGYCIEFVAEDQTSWNASMDTSSGNVRIRVQGAANNNVTWHVTTRVSKLSS